MIYKNQEKYNQIYIIFSWEEICPFSISYASGCAENLQNLFCSLI